MKNSIVSKLAFIFATFVFSGIAPAGIDIVGNGGGLGERLFLDAQSQIESTIALCLRSPDCGTDLNRERLQKLASILNGAGPDFPPLEFAQLDSTESAVAHPPVGSPITINLRIVPQLDRAVEILVFALLNQIEPNQKFVNAIAAASVRRQVPRGSTP